MADHDFAEAAPEKRLFISLVTRDIPLVAAFLDLIDNSINSAIIPFSSQLSTAKDYSRLFADDKLSPKTDINISVSSTEVRIIDNAGGIKFKTAKESAFRFGRPKDVEGGGDDRLSVYGIGLKRALFKLGNKISIVSDHVEGGFSLDIDVPDWADQDPKLPWQFPISRRSPVTPDKTGTAITVRNLHAESQGRISNGVFIGQLQEAIEKTYLFYLLRFVRITLNGKQVQGITLDLSDKVTIKEFDRGGVNCFITAGVGISEGGIFRERNSGWFIFCNGRIVLFSDKSSTTGWGTNGLLPAFQPKHRPFTGLVFFASKNAELLPWTTTKSAINEDSEIWQEALREMSVTARNIISFLDSRYTDEGTEIASRDLSAFAANRVSAMSTPALSVTNFTAPRIRQKKHVKVQYDALKEDVADIAEYLDLSGKNASEVGRRTFHYYLQNVVGKK